MSVLAARVAAEGPLALYSGAILVVIVSLVVATRLAAVMTT